MTTAGVVIILIAIAASIALNTRAKYYAGDVPTHATQATLEQEFAEIGKGNKAEHTTPLPGNAVARLIIPKLGQRWIVVEGVDKDDIANAPGHYTGTAMPGRIGNFAVAGHRSPAIFRYMDRIAVGDLIIVETQTRRYTYKVTETMRTGPKAWYVVDPNPNNPGSKPKVAMLTLTTCDPWYDNTHRLVDHARLIKTEKI
jgi:LPXTG-site transpeptidase (sortase) family protein